MEGFQIKTDESISDLFEIRSDNLASDEEFPVYLASVKKNISDFILPQTVLIKKLSDTSIYKNLLMNTSPYVETVFGILETSASPFAVCEYVRRPSCFDYQMYDALYNSDGNGTLSLDDLIDADHFPCFNIPRIDDRHYLSEKSSLILLQEIIEGLSSFSKAKMVHGDLSPQNILLTDAYDSESPLPFRPVIIDFGISKPFKEAEHQVATIVGTKEFAAPEIMSYNKPTDRVDIYSLGCLFHFMILGKAPGENRNGLRDSEIILSKGVYRIIKKCNADYEIRYRNLKELNNAVHHELHYKQSIPYRIITSIPGFRTHKIWKMLIALYFYAAFIITIIVNIVYRSDMDDDNWLVVGFFACEVIFVCDAFNLRRFFPKYFYWRQRRPVIGHIVRTAIAVIIFIIYVLLYQ